MSTEKIGISIPLHGWCFAHGVVQSGHTCEHVLKINEDRKEWPFQYILTDLEGNEVAKFYGGVKE